MPRRLAISLLTVAFLLPSTPSMATSKVTSAQREVDRLRTLAAEKYETANEAKIKIAQLSRETLRLKESSESIRSKRDIARLLLAKIAIEKYKSDGFSEGFTLLFSGDPTRYISDASTVEIIGRKYALSIRRYATYQQRLTANQLVLADRVTRVKAQQRLLSAEIASAQEALSKAERILSSLTKGDRIRLINTENAREKRIYANSKRVAQSYVGDSSRGSTALMFALNQIGDVYLWGGAGPTRWDCSGLTLRSYQRSGVSLPHSAAVQFNYGKSVSYRALKPGDLVFYGKPISHVAIYMGGGKMVQAPRAGKKVEVVSFTLKFGSKPFIGAKRL